MMIDPYTWMLTPILDIHEVAPHTVMVRVGRPDSYDFTPGQYAIIRVEIDGVGLIRQYSFASAPDSPYLEFLIRRQPLGSVSSWFLDNAKKGDLIRITKPYGRFVIEQTNNPVILVAGGVGIAPFLSMARNNPDCIAALLYNEHSLENAVLDKDITELLGDRYNLILSGETGRINATHFHEYWNTDARYYLCGSKQFVDDIEKLLVDRGVDKQFIHREAFTLQ